MALRITYVLASAVFVLAASTHVARAQEPTRVQGLVTNDNRQPLAGVSVGISSLGVGAFTGDDGRYTFAIPAGRATGQVSLTARRIGFQPVTASINLGVAAITKDFILGSSPTQLEGVVVTALGITREKSQLGTAMQQVDAAELNRTRDQSIVNQLAGKVSGLNVTGSGTQGGSTKLTIRGTNSILGNNNPLFVVDGVPVSNAGRSGSPNGGAATTGGMDFGSAIRRARVERGHRHHDQEGPGDAGPRGHGVLRELLVGFAVHSPGVPERVRPGLRRRLQVRRRRWRRHQRRCGRELGPEARRPTHRPVLGRGTTVGRAAG